MDRLPPFVRDTELEAEVDSSGTIHTVIESPHSQALPRKEVWQRRKYLGEGGFSQVWLESCVEGKKPYEPELRALKVVSLRNDSQLEEYTRELEALGKFSQRKYATYFARSFGWFRKGYDIFITLEYLPLGDLQAYISKNPFVPEDGVREISRQVFASLRFMHDEGFAHRDLKPANILIVSCPPDVWWVKLSDFGLSRRINAVQTSTGVAGTEGYIAPDILAQVSKTNYEPGNGESVEPISRETWLASDIWSFGETMVRMLSSKPTFRNISHLMEYFEGKTGFPLAALEKTGCSDLVVDLIQQAMAAQYQDRFTVHDCLSHAWFKVVDAPDPSSVASLSSQQQGSTASSGTMDSEGFSRESELTTSEEESFRDWTVSEVLSGV